jgi:hypothetical protein
MDFCSNSRELNVVIDNGTFWTLSVRFWAVTVTSSSVSEGVAAGSAASAAVTLQPRVSAHIQDSDDLRTGPIDANVYTTPREARAAFEKVNNKGSIVSIPPRPLNETARRARYANWASIK